MRAGSKSLLVVVIEGIEWWPKWGLRGGQSQQSQGEKLAVELCVGCLPVRF